MQFYAGGQKTNQAANIAETRAATQQPQITTLAIRLNVGGALRVATTDRNAASTKALAIIRKIKPLIAFLKDVRCFSLMKLRRVERQTKSMTSWAPKRYFFHSNTCVRLGR